MTPYVEHANITVGNIDHTIAFIQTAYLPLLSATAARVMATAGATSGESKATSHCRKSSSGHRSTVPLRRQRYQPYRLGE